MRTGRVQIYRKGSAEKFRFLNDILRRMQAASGRRVEMSFSVMWQAKGKLLVRWDVALLIGEVGAS